MNSYNSFYGYKPDGLQLLQQGPAMVGNLQKPEKQSMGHNIVTMYAFESVGQEKSVEYYNSAMSTIRLFQAAYLSEPNSLKFKTRFDVRNMTDYEIASAVSNDRDFVGSIRKCSLDNTGAIWPPAIVGLTKQKFFSANQLPQTHYLFTDLPINIADKSSKDTPIYISDDKGVVIISMAKLIGNTNHSLNDNLVHDSNIEARLVRILTARSLALLSGLDFGYLNPSIRYPYLFDKNCSSEVCTMMDFANITSLINNRVSLDVQDNLGFCFDCRKQLRDLQRK